MSAESSDNTGMLWAITSYFNPAKYARRRVAYDIFREALNIPLLTVEQSLDGNRDLNSDSADIVVHAFGGNTMWQKERLLNLALEALPSECKTVAWLDCDILFKDDGWTEGVDLSLEDAPLVQLFQQVNYLGPDWRRGNSMEEHVERRRPSIASGVSAYLPAAEALEHPSRNERPGTYANGFAWAAHREFIGKHRLFDACIIGGGDRAISCAAYGCYSHLFDWHRMNRGQQTFYLDWAIPFYESCRGRVSYLEGDIYHQWHGKAVDRGLSSRHEGLSAFGFDPRTDIEIDSGGCWRWNSQKPEMHQYFEHYFASRREDG